MTNEETEREERNAPKFPRREGDLDYKRIAKTIVDKALQEDDEAKKKSK